MIINDLAYLEEAESANTLMGGSYDGKGKYNKHKDNGKHKGQYKHNYWPKKSKD